MYSHSSGCTLVCLNCPPTLPYFSVANSSNLSMTCKQWDYFTDLITFKQQFYRFPFPLDFFLITWNRLWEVEYYKTKISAASCIILFFFSLFYYRRKQKVAFMTNTDSARAHSQTHACVLEPHSQTHKHTHVQKVAFMTNTDSARAHSQTYTCVLEPIHKHKNTRMCTHTYTQNQHAWQ